MPRDDVIRILRGTAQKFVERLTLLRAAHSRQAEWEKKQWSANAADVATVPPSGKKTTKSYASKAGNADGGMNFLSNIIESIYKLSQESVDINDAKKKIARAEELYNESKHDPIAGYYYGITLRKYPGEDSRCGKVQSLLGAAMQYCTELNSKKKISDAQRIQCNKTILSDGENLMKDCPPGKAE